MAFRKFGQGEVLSSDRKDRADAEWAGQDILEEPEPFTPPSRTAHLREAEERFYDEEEALKASNPDRG
jgi:hypothetical protein